MPTDPYFRMTVADVFAIKNRGVVVVGQVESGVVKTGDELYINGPSGARKVAVAGLEAFHKQMTQAQTGDNVGILFRDINKGDIQKGDVLSGNDADYSWH